MASLPHRLLRGLVKTLTGFTAAATIMSTVPVSAQTVLPTVVLVHGAWADGSSWDGVTSRLERAGYSVVVTANPLRGLKSDSTYLASILKTINGPIVLVGHSYGGAVITNAAVGASNALALAAVEPGSALAAPPETVFNVVVAADATKPTDVDVYLKSAIFHNAFANDIPSTEATILAARQRPAFLAGALEPSGPPAWKTLPSWFLIGTVDRVIPPAEQMKMANRAHGHIVQVNASHLAMVSHPDVATALIVSAAQDCCAR
jgi:pimeloyl-ACP methyl ester carboxylesterase